jgi:precorrin-2 methylase
MKGVSSLVVVGSGIQAGGDLTRTAGEHIRRADKLLYLVSERITMNWLHEQNPSAESLHVFYAFDKPRETTYQEMSAHILSYVRRGLSVCVVCYGHPGVFADPMHEAVRCCRAEGYEARMYPGISSIDWLYADLAIDPAVDGCQVFDATDYLVRHRRPDVTGGLVLLQVGIIGEDQLPKESNMRGFRQLVDRLRREYGPDHEVVLYEAAQYVIAAPLVQRVTLAQALELAPTFGSTLYVPPKARPEADEELRAELTAH